MDITNKSTFNRTIGRKLWLRIHVSVKWFTQRDEKISSLLTDSCHLDLSAWK